MTHLPWHILIEVVKILIKFVYWNSNAKVIRNNILIGFSFFHFILQVCEQEKCFEPVLPLAVNLFDRFLSKCSVPKNFLQLIAADCILIASKIRQSLPVPINKLCYFTDHSVTPCQFRVSELFYLLLRLICGCRCIDNTHAASYFYSCNLSPVSSFIYVF